MSSENVRYAVERMRDCARKAQIANENVVKRRDKVRAKVEQEVFQGKRTTLDRDLSTIQDTLAASDPLYRSHIADNNWYIQQTIMWATVAQVELELEKRDQTARSLREAHPPRTE